MSNLAIACPQCSYKVFGPADRADVLTRWMTEHLTDKHGATLEPTC